MPNARAATLARVAEIEQRVLRPAGWQVEIPVNLRSQHERDVAWLCAQLRAALGEEAGEGSAFKQWDDAGEAECFNRIREAVGDPPCNAKHAAQYACDIVGQWLRSVSPAPAAGTTPEREAAWREALEYANKMLIQSGDRTLHMGLAIEHLRKLAALSRHDGEERMNDGD